MKELMAVPPLYENLFSDWRLAQIWILLNKHTLCELSARP